MSRRKVQLMAFIVSATIFLWGTAPTSAFRISRPGIEAQAASEIDALSPLSIQMVDEAIAVLSMGWAGMDGAEQETFLRLYDPSGSGEIDEQFVTAVRENYIRVRRAFDGEIPVRYEPQSGMCEGMRLYYTDLLILHVCPYFLTEMNEMRKARTLIHEYVHIALHVKDRPYYRPTSESYARLTPRGSGPSRLPVIGLVIRAIAANDTLNHPDAYAHFAVAVSGRPGALEMYLDQSIDLTAAEYIECLHEHVRSNLVVDSWAQQRG